MTCLSCENEELRCISCRELRYLFEYKCLTKCPTHYFPLNRICMKCSSDCFDCENTSSYCISCYDLKILHKGICIGVDESTHRIQTKISYKNNNVSIQVISNKILPPEVIKSLEETTLIYILLNTNE